MAKRRLDSAAIQAAFARTVWVRRSGRGTLTIPANATSVNVTATGGSVIQTATINLTIQ